MAAVSTTLSYLSLALCLSASANAYFLTSLGTAITRERLDPIVNPGGVSGHAHLVFGGSNFGRSVTTDILQKSECTSVPIVEDKSNYWAPAMYFEWANGSFTSVDGGAVAYYLFPNKPGSTTAFPPDFRMLSGNPVLRTYDPNSFAQQAIDFLCLDFEGETTRHNTLPEKQCRSGIRSQTNFPSCWDGKNLDSPDHKSHVAFLSEGPDKGECKDPKYPVRLPRIFLEIYWATGEFDKYRSQARHPDQPFVLAHGDGTGLGNHADFYNGWASGVLQRVVDECTCNDFGDPTCCGQEGKKLFTIQKDKQCRITPSLDERTTGTLPKLPGKNPIQPAGKDATMYKDNVIPAILAPVYAYTGNNPPARGTVVVPATTLAEGAPPPTVAPPQPTVAPTSSSVSSSAVPSVTVRPPGSSPLPPPTNTGAPQVTAKPPASSPALPSSSSSPVVVNPPNTNGPQPLPTASHGSPRPPAPSSSPVGAPTITLSTRPAAGAPTHTAAPSAPVPAVPISSSRPVSVGTGPVTRTVSATGASPTGSLPPAYPPGPGTSAPSNVGALPTGGLPPTRPPGPVASAPANAPTTTRTSNPSRPTTTRICKKKPIKNPFHGHNYNHGKPGKKHFGKHFNKGHQRRHDFDVDYHQVA